MIRKIVYSSSRNTRNFSRGIRAQKGNLLHRGYNPAMKNKRSARMRTDAVTKGQRMEFYKKMYISPKIRDPRRIRQDLQRGKGHLTVYLLVLTEGPEGRPQLEIMHCANFLQPYYKDHSVYVIGMASGKADAIQMVNMITQEAFDRTGQWEAALYLAKRTGWVPMSEELPGY